MLKYVGYDIVFQEVPDEVTLAVNLSLCPFRCKGCHSSYLQTDIGEELNENTLVSLVEKYAGEITCVCLMGGDNDSRRVEELLLFLKQKYGERLRTAWYSGSNALPQHFRPEAFDYVKIGSYDAGKGALREATTNQRFFKVSADGALSDITAAFQKHHL